MERLIVTKVVFELNSGDLVLYYLIRLIVTKVVFEYNKTELITDINNGLIVTKVVFESVFSTSKFSTAI